MYKDLFEKVDALMITSPFNLQYFSKFKGGEGVCIIGKGYNALFVDSRYTIEAKLEAKGFDVIKYKSGKLYDAIYSVLTDKCVKVLGFEDEDISVLIYNKVKEKLEKIELLGISKDLSEIRMIKSDEEISHIRKAEEIGDKAFNYILPMIKEGVCEIEIVAELEYFMRKCGGEGTSFETIVVSGAKSGMPHGKPNYKKLEKGDFVTMDFGCIVNGYCSDMTRTVVIGAATQKQMEIYNTVLSAQIEGLKMLKEGVCAKDVDAVARDIIKRAGYGDCFGHSLGHGVGLKIHELPNLSPNSDFVLKENMVVTCEPGIYIENYGGVRIEDTVVIKKDGIENLTSSPKELIICR